MLLPDFLFPRFLVFPPANPSNFHYKIILTIRSWYISGKRGVSQNFGTLMPACYIATCSLICRYMRHQTCKKSGPGQYCRDSMGYCRNSMVYCRGSMVYCEAVWFTARGSMIYCQAVWFTARQYRGYAQNVAPTIARKELQSFTSAIELCTLSHKTFICITRCCVLLSICSLLHNIIEANYLFSNVHTSSLTGNASILEEHSSTGTTIDFCFQALLLFFCNTVDGIQFVHCT